MRKKFQMVNPKWLITAMAAWFILAAPIHAQQGAVAIDIKTRPNGRASIAPISIDIPFVSISCA